MKKTPSQPAEPDLRPEYDFSGGVRGKYARRYAHGSDVAVRQPMNQDIVAFSGPEGVLRELRRALTDAGFAARQDDVVRWSRDSVRFVIAFQKAAGLAVCLLRFLRERRKRLVATGNPSTAIRGDFSLEEAEEGIRTVFMFTVEDDV